MRVDQILASVHEIGIPIADAFYGDGLRVGATLKDGTVLPCVLLRSPDKITALADKRFAETRGRNDLGFMMDYQSILRTFICRRNTIDIDSVKSVNRCPFAISQPMLTDALKGGESAMAWNQFTATMADGTVHNFGTSWDVEFFDMPSGYTASDIASVCAHNRLPDKCIFRSRPFFVCYTEGL